MNPEIKVKNSGVIRVKAVPDPGRGMLYAAEAEKEVPFAIRRVYFMTGMDSSAVRGNHAHRKVTQAIFCVAGSFTLALDDGTTKQTTTMSDPSCGIILGPHLWATMSGFSKDCVILVCADDYYDENEYIRDYAEFSEMVKKNTGPTV